MSIAAILRHNQLAPRLRVVAQEAARSSALDTAVAEIARTNSLKPAFDALKESVSLAPLFEEINQSTRLFPRNYLVDGVTGGSVTQHEVDDVIDYQDATRPMYPSCYPEFGEFWPSLR